MAFNPQFKINQMAKDMGLKSKELTDLLADKGIGDIKSQKTLTEQEFNILFQTMTEANQVDNIYDYMDGKTCIPSKIAAAKAAERAAREKAEAEARAAAEAEAARIAADTERLGRAVGKTGAVAAVGVTDVSLYKALEKNLPHEEAAGGEPDQTVASHSQAPDGAND